MNAFIVAADKPNDRIKVFIDGQGILAQSITRKLIDNHGLLPNNILVNTYRRSDNATYLGWLADRGIMHCIRSYNDDQFYDLLSDFAPDYIISAYGLRIFPRRFLDLASTVAFNCHPSFLPDYKGRWIPSWAIINGEQEHGITIHIMDDSIDTGPVLFQKKVPIHIDDTAFVLYNRLMCEFVTIFDGFFQTLVSGQIRSISMAEGGRYFGKHIPYNGQIDPAWPIDRIERFIRAMYYPPFMGASATTAGGTFECCTLQDYLSLINQQFDLDLTA